MSKLISLMLFSAASFAFAASAAAQDEAQLDQLQIQVQQICPVTGQKLGSMGDPIKTTIDEQTMFLCCKACDGKPGRDQHVKTIDANLAMAQAKCPVMDEDLPEDAEAVVFDGRKVFVCCEDCLETIKEDAKTYLSKVAHLYEEYLKKQADRSR